MPDQEPNSQAQAVPQNGAAQDRIVVSRSPRYPTFDLPTAIERAQEFYEGCRFNAVNAEVAARRWGYTAKSSRGGRALAALTYYGLLETEGTGDDRRVKLTDIGRDIVVDTRPDSPRRKEAIRKAALSPALYRELWHLWRDGGLPDDDTIEFHLVRELGFNPEAVAGFITDFRATLRFAELTSDNVSSGSSPTPPSDEAGEADGPGDLFGSVFGSLFAAPPSAPRSEAPTMTAAQNAAQNRSDVKPLDILLPLDEDVFAVLRLPSRLTQEQYDTLNDLLEANLKAVKRRVEKATPQAPATEPTAPTNGDGAPS